jgi:hypothetical protein
MVECELCGGKAKGICPRCYRYVCENCVDPITLYCLDCRRVKEEIEKDLERYLDGLAKKIEFMERRRCYDCILYKDELMSSLRRLKELKNLSKLEMYDSIYDKACELEEKVKKLAIEYLIKLKMNPESFS